MVTDEQFEKLPRYAQREIERLRQNLDALRASQVMTEAGQTDTKWIDYHDGVKGNYLPSGTAVVFFEKIEARAEFDHHGREIVYVMGVGAGPSGLVMQPFSSNVVQVRTEGQR